MFKAILFVVIASFSLNASMDVLWTKTLVGYSLKDMKKTRDGGFVFVGDSTGATAVVIRTDSVCNVKWIKKFVFTLISGAIDTTESNGCIVAVKRLSSDTTNVMWLDSLGNVQLRRALFLVGYYIVTSIKSLPQYRFYIIGVNPPYSGGDGMGSAAFLCKVDSATGTIIHTSYGESFYYGQQMFYSFRRQPTGFIAIGSKHNSYTKESSGWFCKINDNQTVARDESLDQNGTDGQIFALSDSESIIVGGDSIGEVIRIKDYGYTVEYVWKKFIWTDSAKGLPCHVKRVDRTSDGNLIVSGRDNLGHLRLWKMTMDGDTLWTKTYPFPGEDSTNNKLCNVVNMGNGKYFVASDSGLNSSIATFAMLYEDPPQPLIKNIPINTFLAKKESEMPVMYLIDGRKIGNISGERISGFYISIRNGVIKKECLR